MEIKLEHHFVNTCYDIDKLFKGVNTLSKFLRNLDKQSTENPAMWDPNKYKGDGFECLVEAIIKLHPVDKRINITNYQPSPVDEMGIDGSGETLNGMPHEVQAKMSMDPTKLITEQHEHIAMFPGMAGTKHMGKKFQMTLFTTGKDLHYVLENFHGKVRVLGYYDIQKLIDHPTFWQLFYNLMLDK
tara:strand:+ start:74 stop:631 length:558 start_codon:yes stop_codon:yes gene_type:complete